MLVYHAFEAGECLSEHTGKPELNSFFFIIWHINFRDIRHLFRYISKAVLFYFFSSVFFSFELVPVFAVVTLNLFRFSVVVSS